MSFSYDRYDRQQRRAVPSQRTALNYWLPLGITVASAAIGLAIWAWNERKDPVYETSSDGDSQDDSYSRGKRSISKRNDKRSTTATQSQNLDAESLEVGASSEQQETMFSRMSGAIMRTPSPQQMFDGAHKRVVAGVAAAGAVVGRGLSTLKESDDDFQDHETWSAEAEARSARPAESREIQNKRKRMVAVVVSAESHGYDSDHEIEHASILSHLPHHIDAQSVDLVVLIYAPELTSYPLPTTSPSQKRRTASSTASSFEEISATPIEDEAVMDEAVTPGGYYGALQASALRLVPHPTHIIPFTTPTGHVHILRHLSPSLVYIQEDLSGESGENIKQIEGWVGQIVVVVGESLAADTETEDEGPARKPVGGEWWKDSSRVGLGKADVVEMSRFEEDWIKRVGA